MIGDEDSWPVFSFFPFFFFFFFFFSLDDSIKDSITTDTRQIDNRHIQTYIRV